MYSQQKEILLPKLNRGFHLITEYIINAIEPICNIKIGLLHVFIKHTSASITINENSDPCVRKDMEVYFNRNVLEDEAYYSHIHEGLDDMPAHIKSSLLGSSITIPITNGKLSLGIWQGVYLGEHRNIASNRTLVITVISAT